MELTVRDRKILVSEDGLIFPDDLTFDEWSEILAGLKQVKEQYHCALADTVRFGVASFGEEKVTAKMVQLEFSNSDFQAARDISRIPVGLRQNAEGLTSEHFHVVGKEFSDDEVQQKKWLKVASDHALTPRDLRRSIEIGAVSKGDAKKSGRSSGGVITIQNIVYQFGRWASAVEGAEVFARKKDQAELREWLRLTDEFAAFRKAIEASIEDGPEY